MPEEVITTSGLEVFVKAAAEALTHCVIGDDDTEPQPNDARLGNETARNVIGDTYILGNQAQIRTFFTNAELPAVIEELGWVAEGQQNANTGRLVVHSRYNYDPNVNDVLIIINLVASRDESI